MTNFRRPRVQSTVVPVMGVVVVLVVLFGGSVVVYNQLEDFNLLLFGPQREVDVSVDVAVGQEYHRPPAPSLVNGLG